MMLMTLGEVEFGRIMQEVGRLRASILSTNDTVRDDADRRRNRRDLLDKMELFQWRVLHIVSPEVSVPEEEPGNGEVLG